MPYIVSDSGVAILDIEGSEDDFVTFQCVGEAFFIDTFDSLEKAKNGDSPIATYTLYKSDVLGALEKMGVI